MVGKVKRGLGQIFIIAVGVGLPVWILTGASKANAPKIPRIGIVKLQQVFERYDYAIAKQKEISAELKPEADKLRAMNEKLRQMQQDLRNSGSTIRPGSTLFKLKMLGIQKQKLELQSAGGKFEKLRREKMSNFFRTIYNHFRSAITAIGDHYKFDLVITASDAKLSADLEKPTASPDAIQSEITLRRVQYVSSAVDITDTIIRQMNATYKKSLQP